MTDKMAIEKIAQRLHNRYFRKDERKPWNKLTKEQHGLWENEAEELLFFFDFEDIYESLGYVQKDPDQSLPKPSIFVPSESDCETNEDNHIARYYYLTGLQDILKAGWFKAKEFTNNCYADGSKIPKNLPF